jgi:hypothetical protein
MTESEFPYAQGLLGIVNPYKIPETETEAEYLNRSGALLHPTHRPKRAFMNFERFLSKLSEEKARVIFAGMRLGDLADRIRAMARADKIDPTVQTEIDTCLTQLDLIGGARCETSKL